MNSFVPVASRMIESVCVESVSSAATPKKRLSRLSPPFDLMYRIYLKVRSEPMAAPGVPVVEI